MNEPDSGLQREPRWLTYFRAAAFVAPAMVVLWFCVWFLFPRLEQIWADAGFADPVVIQMFAVTVWVLQQGLWLAALLIGALGLLEWRWKSWSRYRKGLVEFCALAFNAATLIVVTTMFTSALLAAPALRLAR
jgi:type II secretory pathway component PulF